MFQFSQIFRVPREISHNLIEAYENSIYCPDNAHEESISKSVEGDVLHFCVKYFKIILKL